jgi:ADP-ribose pyrophosphatase YjhB (NUDIX family)
MTKPKRTPENAPKPTARAKRRAKEIMAACDRFHLAPSLVCPSVEGGIGVSYTKPYGRAYIECSNNGTTTAGWSRSNSGRLIWTVRNGSEGALEAAAILYNLFESARLIGHPDAERSSLTSDLVLFAVKTGKLNVLTVTRANDPFKGMLALPGGFLKPGEEAMDAAMREMSEETGIASCGISNSIQYLNAYHAPGRDPRGRIVSFAFWALLPGRGDGNGQPPEPKGADDAASAEWIPLSELSSSGLAFDHKDILTAAIFELRKEHGEIPDRYEPQDAPRKAIIYNDTQAWIKKLT